MILLPKTIKCNIIGSYFLEKGDNGNPIYLNGRSPYESFDSSDDNTAKLVPVSFRLMGRACVSLSAYNPCKVVHFASSAQWSDRGIYLANTDKKFTDSSDYSDAL
jgi:hypothetical protein